MASKKDKDIRHKACKFRIYPTKEQRILFAKTFGCARLVWNLMLSEKNDYYNETGKTLKVTPAKYKADRDFLTEVDSLALANEQIYLERAFREFFDDPDVGYPKFKSKKKDKKSYTTNLVNGNIILTKNHIRLPKVGWVKVKVHRDIPDGYQLKSVTVSQTHTDKYYVSVLFEYKKQVQKVYPETFLGLDYSVPELYVDSRHNRPEYPKYYRKSEERLAFEQRKLSRMQYGSNNYEKQKRKIAKIHEHIANQRRDFLHKKSRQLADEYDCICVEDIDLQAMAQTLNLGKSVNDDGFGFFRIFLQYKLEEQGKWFVKADKFFASTQTCSVCGTKNPETKNLSVREWACPVCGTHHNRDDNAADNLEAEGKRIVLGMIADNVA